MFTNNLVRINSIVFKRRIYARRLSFAMIFFVCRGARPRRCCFRFYFMGKGGAPQRADAVIALGKNINNAGAFAGGAPDNFRFFTEGGTKERSFGKCGRGDKSVLLYAINVENCIHFEYMFFIKTVQE